MNVHGSLAYHIKHNIIEHINARFFRQLRAKDLSRIDSLSAADDSMLLIRTILHGAIHARLIFEEIKEFEN